MRDFDAEGLLLAKYQGEIFLSSVKMQECSSPVFLRRYYRSEFARKMDEGPSTLFSLDVREVFSSLDRQFGKSAYGKEKYDPEALYWLGYITRYISYTREMPSSLLYKAFPPKSLIAVYPGYHTQSEEWVVERLLEKTGRTSYFFDPNARLAQALERKRGL